MILSIGEKIKNLRKEKGITQRDLSEKINYSHSYIGDLESNRTNPSIKTLEILAEYFNVDTVYFFETKCCYQKLLEGQNNFCYCNDSSCMTCPLNISITTDKGGKDK